MFRRYTFILVFLIGICSSAWVSEHMGKWDEWEGLSARGTGQLSEGAKILSRRALLETLDRVVTYERYFRSVFGRFTPVLGRTGYSIPKEVSDLYEIRVIDAGKANLSIVAFSEQDGKTEDVVKIDGNYQIHANFELPPPRAEYLKAMAIRRLRALASGSSSAAGPDGMGAYKGYFRFELPEGTTDSKRMMAIGLRSPVLDARIDLASVPDGAGVTEGMPRFSIAPADAQRMTSDEALLAQRIFRGEMGRDARDWAELSLLASFQFDQDNPSPALAKHLGFLKREPAQLIIEPLNDAPGIKPDPN